MNENQRTKKAFGTTLIELCQEKDFNKLNIADLADRLNYSRQAFYYHFTDKYALLEWVYEEDSLHYLSNEVTLDNWQERVYQMLEQMQKKTKFYQQTIQSDPTILERRFIELIQELFLALFTKEEEVTQISSQDRLFYAEFFSYGCSGVLLKWIRGGMKESSEMITQKLTRLAHDSAFIVQRLEENQGKPLDNFFNPSKN